MLKILKYIIIKHEKISVRRKNMKKYQFDRIIKIFNHMQKVNIFPEYHKNKIIITCSSFANKRFSFTFVNAR